MSATLFYDLRARPLDSNGAIMPGCYYEFYESQTDTPTPVYADDGLSSELGTTVTSASDGRFPVMYLDAAVVYRVKLFDAAGSLQYEADPVHPHVAIPPGTIVMFDGTAEDRDAAYPTALWQLCDGTGGSPDSRDRGPVGVSNTKDIGTSGGNSSGTTEDAGAHDHGGTTDPTVLTDTNMPVHHHRLYAWNVNGSDVKDDGFGSAGHVSVTGEINSGGEYIDENAGGDQLIEDAGDADPDGHDHGITAAADHAHDFDAQSPYFTVWFLKRKA